ncbi:MAG: AbrB/MazE/SpoVT family DNA-binding domain-containing protein, partial [Clostridiales bacterium]|nr:AbrB/MazE/SpoVT family DNA-binding domain-containing protein [Clostridiales bacterium]
MKSMKLTREVDSLGRIVLPRTILKQMNVHLGEDAMEFFLDEIRIILRRYERGCIFCSERTDVVPFKDG